MDISKLVLYKNCNDVNEKKLLENSLVSDNIRLVYYTINTYFSWLSVDIDELFQAGCIGLLRAVRYFDVSSKYSFSTYAVVSIKRAIIKELVNITGLSLEELNLRKIIIERYYDYVRFKFIADVNFIFNDLKGIYPLYMINKVINYIIIEKGLDYDNMVNMCDGYLDKVDINNGSDDRVNNTLLSEGELIRLVSGGNVMYSKDYSLDLVNKFFVEDILSGLDEDDSKLLRDYYGIGCCSKKLEEIASYTLNKKGNKITAAGVASKRDNVVRKIRKRYNIC